jgi:protein-tyrosine-phosphatase/DNA-binding transcriptional ArsR family regulator
MSTPTPPEFLQLAGHPLRWRLLGELARSDRAVSELTERVGEPQNLVSYHLGKLREAQLVSARKSDADRRDAYYGLDLSRLGALLSAAGGALHPGLKLIPPPAIIPAEPVKLLFLCTGNSARSPMAQALACARSGGAFAAASAGSHPRPLHPNALKVMADDYGLDLSAHAPTSLSVYAEADFDCVISLCDRVREVCPPFAGETIHWSIANPATGEADDMTLPKFRAAAAQLTARIDFLLARLGEPAS